MYKVVTIGVWMARINVRRLGRPVRVTVHKSNLKGESKYIREIFSYIAY